MLNSMLEEQLAFVIFIRKAKKDKKKNRFLLRKNKINLHFLGHHRWYGQIFYDIENQNSY